MSRKPIFSFMKLLQCYIEQLDQQTRTKLETAVKETPHRWYENLRNIAGKN